MGSKNREPKASRKDLGGYEKEKVFLSIKEFFTDEKLINGSNEGEEPVVVVLLD